MNVWSKLRSHSPESEVCVYNLSIIFCINKSTNRNSNINVSGRFDAKRDAFIIRETIEVEPIELCLAHLSVGVKRFVYRRFHDLDAIKTSV